MKGNEVQAQPLYDEARLPLVRDHEDGAAIAPHDPFPAQAVREVARLFAESETSLAVIDRKGGVVCSGERSSDRALLEDLFAAPTVGRLRELLSDTRRESVDAAQVLRGRTVDNRDVELRVIRSERDDEYCIALVRPLADAAADRARSRVRQLSAALQAVADIVVPLDELQGHEEARRRASLVALLTDRERRVALAVADGVRTSQIAADLFVSQSTVRNYLPSIYRKLGVRSRPTLVELLNSPG